MGYHESMDKHERYGLAHPERIKARQSAWRAAHRDRRNAQNLKARHARAAFIRGCKVGKVCLRCQEPDIDRLHFHHVDPETKLFQIGRSDRSIAAIIIEMEKCVLLCRSCHTKTHHELRPGQDQVIVLGLE
jgi:hypothetical protein